MSVDADDQSTPATHGSASPEADVVEIGGEPTLLAVPYRPSARGERPTTMPGERGWPGRSLLPKDCTDVRYRSHREAHLRGVDGLASGPDRKQLTDWVQKAHPMAEDVKPTRKNLMQIEDRIDLSERGHDTLEKKRDGLIMEFMDILDQAQDVRSELEDDYDRAQEAIDVARAMDGDVAVRGAAAALKEHPEITTQSKNIMGVVVPQIESSKVKKSLDERGYGLLGSSARIDEAADAYEELVESVILAAEVETAMKKMLEEIETTKRRVNALEFTLLPRLYENQEYIEQKLEEQEREEIFRMKKIKAKKEREEAEERAQEDGEPVEEPLTADD